MARDDAAKLPQDLMAQFRETLERLGAVAGQMPGVTAQMLGMPTVPMPGGLAAGQVSAIVGAIRAQRSSITTMRTSLDAYEQQLKVLEELMGPLETMTKSWAHAEKRITG